MLELLQATALVKKRKRPKFEFYILYSQFRKKFEAL